MVRMRSFTPNVHQSINKYMHSLHHNQLHK